MSLGLSYVSRRKGQKVDSVTRIKAKRTAFIARFIVLREGRRSRAHRIIEQMFWTENTSAEELAVKIRLAFVENGDKMQPVDRDIKRALGHAEKSVDYFLDHYLARGTLTFREALIDYERSNSLLFGDQPEDVPRRGGWRLSRESVN